MEYVYYLLVIISILSLLIGLHLRSAKLREESKRNSIRVQVIKNVPGQRQKKESGTESPASQLVALSRRMSHVPTPWGWPGHKGKGEYAGYSESARSSRSSDDGITGDALHQWVDRLMAGKRTVEDQEYVLKKNASLRALLEDRYGTSGEKRDLSSRLQNSPERKKSGLKREARQLTDAGAKRSVGAKARLQDIRVPWGW